MHLGPRPLSLLVIVLVDHIFTSQPVLPPWLLSRYAFDSSFTLQQGCGLSGYIIRRQLKEEGLLKPIKYVECAIKKLPEEDNGKEGEGEKKDMTHEENLSKQEEGNNEGLNSAAGIETVVFYGLHEKEEEEDMRVIEDVEDTNTGFTSSHPPSSLPHVHRRNAE